MELDNEKLQPYIKRFIEFYETEDYWDEEREYKEKLYSATDKLFKRDNIESSSFKKELFNWLTDKENQQAIINLTHNIPYQRFKYIVENEYLSNEEIAPLFIDLLFNSDGIGKKLGRFRKGFDVLAERTGAGDLQYDLCTLFVAYKYPDDFLVYKRDYMREFCSNFVEGAEFKGRPVEKYVMFSEIAPEIRDLLESYKPDNTAWSDDPKIDMMDVQVFVYLIYLYFRKNHKSHEYAVGVFGDIGEGGDMVNHLLVNVCWHDGFWNGEVCPGANSGITPLCVSMRGPEENWEVECKTKGNVYCTEGYTFDGTYKNGGFQHPQRIRPTRFKDGNLIFVASRGVNEKQYIVGFYFKAAFTDEQKYRFAGSPEWSTRFFSMGILEISREEHTHNPDVTIPQPNFTYIDDTKACNILNDAIEVHKPELENDVSENDKEEILEIIKKCDFVLEELKKKGTEMNVESTDIGLERAVENLKAKRQIILCGPPGTGKTYVSKKLVKSETGEEEAGERWELIQFHPTYTYEDIDRGLVATSADGGVSFEPQDKIFARMCARANADYERAINSNTDPNTFILIIDEINRADISKVFGELIYGLEYRGEPVETPYEIDGSTTLTIPPNLYIIGTMNTADKSIAMLDYALRRRFAFIPMYPDAEIIKSYYSDDYPETKRIALNLFKMVAGCFNDSARDLAVGHTYFMVGEKDEGVIYAPYTKGVEDAEPLNDGDAFELLCLKFIYETAPLIHEYILAGEEGVKADDIKKAYEKGNIEDNLAYIFEAWISGRNIKDDEGAEEGENTIEDDGDIGEDSE